jgi:hypothetical protein
MSESLKMPRDHPAMSQVQLIPQYLHCLECGAESDEHARGWKAYVRGAYEGDDVEVGVFCPMCATREFANDC